MYKQYRYEYGYPYCSCYTKPDLRHLVSKSKSLSFDTDRFVANSYYMGVEVLSTNERKKDIIESKYYVDREPGFGCNCGSRDSDTNNKPFYSRGHDYIVFTIRAIFAGRDHNKRERSIRECCHGECYACGCKIGGRMDECTPYTMRHGSVLSFGDTRYEALCDDCCLDFLKTIRPWRPRESFIVRDFPDMSLEDQVAFTRFVQLRRAE